MRNILIMFFFIQMFSLNVHAQFRSKNEAGLGYTDNANLESSQEDSDLFMRISSLNNYRSGAHLLGLKLGLVDYFNENSNDAFSWRMSDRWKDHVVTPWSFYGALSGQQFLADESGLTETSFNYVGWDFSMDRAHSLNRKTELTFGPGLSGRYYTSHIAERSDHTVFGFAEIEHEFSDRLTFGGRTEIGWLVSSDENYSRTYFELSGNSGFALNRDWKWNSEIGFKRSHFTNRTASTETIVSARRGSVRTRTLTEMEAYTYGYLYTEFIRKLAQNLDLGLSLQHISQTSRSGFQDYSVDELLARLILSF
jgi:hypothetical protein